MNQGSYLVREKSFSHGLGYYIYRGRWVQVTEACTLPQLNNLSNLTLKNGSLGGCPRHLPLRHPGDLYKCDFTSLSSYLGE